MYVTRFKIPSVVPHFYIFNISLQSISVGFGDINLPRLLKMFALVAPGRLRPFFIKNGSYHTLLSSSYFPQKIGSSCSRISLRKASLHGTKLVYFLRNSSWCRFFYYFFAGIVFYSFILALMPSYRASRFFKLIAWTTSNVEQRLEFWIGWLISNTYIPKV